jgi:phage terminase large subunit GpA-like protein
MIRKGKQSKRSSSRSSKRGKTAPQTESNPFYAIWGQSLSFLISQRCLGTLRPRPKVRTVDWAQRAITRMPMQSSTKTLDFSRFPHVIDVLDSFDDDNCEEITLQWAARLGKTFTFHLMIASTLANHPFPCIWGDADETTVHNIFDRLWQTLDSVDELRESLPPRNLRKNDQICTKVGIVYGGWAKSAATAADKDARLVILNEADKMVQASTRLEADYRLLLKKRAKNFPHPKIAQASTPTVLGKSYIEAARLKGDNRRREVPCPHCGHYQTLRIGDGKTPGGVRFEKLHNGKMCPTKAKETAWYDCEKCRARIEEGHRLKMLQSGLWVPEGCYVHDEKIAGTPTRPGTHHSFGPLSSLHSLVSGASIGDHAKRWVDANTDQNRSESLRDFLNSDEGLTWSPAPSVTLISSLEQRLGEERPMGIVPAWARFLTLGADVSGLGSEDLQFHWWVSAWGVGGRGCQIDAGTIYRRSEFKDWLKTVTWHCPERGGMFRPAVSLVDSGSFTQLIYEMCDQSNGLMIPVKGSSRHADKPFSNDDAGYLMAKGGFRGDDDASRRRLKKSYGEYDLVLINTHLSQEWCEERLNGIIGPTEASYYSVPKEIFSLEKIAVMDLPRHMVGDYRHGGSWLKRYEEQHYRDAWRYSRVAADIHTKHGSLWDDPTDEIILPQPERRDTQSTEHQGTPGFFGGAFLVTDRFYGSDDDED